MKTFMDELFFCCLWFAGAFAMLLYLAERQGEVKRIISIYKLLNCTELLTSCCLYAPGARRSVSKIEWRSDSGTLCSGEELEKSTAIQVNLVNQLRRLQCTYRPPRARRL